MSIPNKTILRRRYDRRADAYLAAAAVIQEIGARLLTRLEYIKCKPRRILDLGSGPGGILPALQQRYPRAQLLAADLSLNMLRQIPTRWLAQNPWRLQCDAERLPLAAESIDMVISVAAFQYCLQPDKLFNELSRVLKPGGLLLFASFGPDSLRELRAAAMAADMPETTVPTFIDMHDLGDAMVRAGLADPVMDSETLSVTYPDVQTGLRELGRVAPSATLAARRTRKNFLHTLCEQYPRQNDARIAATLEIVYGHAWGNAVRKLTKPGGTEVRISLDVLRRR